MAQAQPKLAGQGIQDGEVVALKVDFSTKFQILQAQFCLHQVNKIWLLVVQQIWKVFQKPNVFPQNVIRSCLQQHFGEHFTCWCSLKLKEDVLTHCSCLWCTFRRRLTRPSILWLGPLLFHFQNLLTKVVRLSFGRHPSKCQAGNKLMIIEEKNDYILKKNFHFYSNVWPLKWANDFIRKRNNCHIMKQTNDTRCIVLIMRMSIAMLLI